jgi:putative addiction module component (TIGR02574 family)
MGSSYTRILKAALSLSEPERLELVDELLSTFATGKAAPFDDEWLAEIQRRSQEYDKGRVKTVAWEKVKAGARRLALDNGPV